MAFSLNRKSIQISKDSRMAGIQTIQDKNFSTKKTSGSPDQTEYIDIDKLKLGEINERGMDDLTGASYVSDASWECEAATYMTAGIAYGVTTVIAGGTTKNPSITLGAAEAAATFSAMAVRASCDDDFILGSGLDPLIFSSPDGGNGGNPSGGNQGDPMEQGSFGIEEPDNSDGNNNDNENGNTDPDNDNGDDADDNDNASDANSDGDSWWASLWESITGGGEDTEAGGDDSNPNPEADGSQGSTSKPTIGPAPGDIGGRYDSVVNPGAERGFTPGNDGDGDGYGNPGNPWDRNERMSTPNGDGDPIDPLTGFGGPSDPEAEGNDGSPDDPDAVGNDGGPGDDLWKPNPDDTWGGGPNSQSVEGNEIEKIFEFTATQSFDSTSDLQGKDLMIASMSVDTFGL